MLVNIRMIYCELSVINIIHTYIHTYVKCYSAQYTLNRPTVHYRSSDKNDKLCTVQGICYRPGTGASISSLCCLVPGQHVYLW